MRIQVKIFIAVILLFRTMFAFGGEFKTMVVNGEKLKFYSLGDGTFESQSGLRITGDGTMYVDRFGYWAFFQDNNTVAKQRKETAPPVEVKQNSVLDSSRVTNRAKGSSKDKVESEKNQSRYKYDNVYDPDREMIRAKLNGTWERNNRYYHHGIGDRTGEWVRRPETPISDSLQKELMKKGKGGTLLY